MLSQQAEVEAEQAKLKDVQQQLKENAEKASKDESERADQVLQVRTLSQRNQMAREKNERMLEQHSSRLAVAEQAHADTRRAWTALEAERSKHTRELEDNDSLVRELRAIRRRRKERAEWERLVEETTRAEEERKQATEAADTAAKNGAGGSGKEARVGGAGGASDEDAALKLVGVVAA